MSPKKVQPKAKFPLASVFPNKKPSMYLMYRRRVNDFEFIKKN